MTCMSLVLMCQRCCRESADHQCLPAPILSVVHATLVHLLWCNTLQIEWNIVAAAARAMIGDGDSTTFQKHKSSLSSFPDPKQSKDMPLYAPASLLCQASTPLNVERLNPGIGWNLNADALSNTVLLYITILGFGPADHGVHIRETPAARHSTTG